MTEKTNNRRTEYPTSIDFAPPQAESEEKYQELTNVMFERTGYDSRLSKPMVDDTMAWHLKEVKAAVADVIDEFEKLAKDNTIILRGRDGYDAPFVITHHLTNAVKRLRHSYGLEGEDNE